MLLALRMCSNKCYCNFTFSLYNGRPKLSANLEFFPISKITDRDVSRHPQNPQVPNWRCRLTQVDPCNGRKNGVIVVVVCCCNSI